MKGVVVRLHHPVPHYYITPIHSIIAAVFEITSPKKYPGLVRRQQMQRLGLEGMISSCTRYDPSTNLDDEHPCYALVVWKSVAAVVQGWIISLYITV
jgi:hypothetical protein